MFVGVGDREDWVWGGGGGVDKLISKNLTKRLPYQPHPHSHCTTAALALP